MAWPFSLAAVLRWSADDPAARRLPPPRGIGKANHEFPSRPAVQPGAELTERGRHEGREEHTGSNSACQTSGAGEPTHPPTLGPHCARAWHSLIDLSLWRGPRSAPPAQPGSPEPRRRGPRARGGRRLRAGAAGAEWAYHPPHMGPGGVIYDDFTSRFLNERTQARATVPRDFAESRALSARAWVFRPAHCATKSRAAAFPHAHRFFIVRQNLGPPPGAMGARPRPRAAGPSSDPPSHPHAHSGAGGPRGSESRRL